MLKKVSVVIASRNRCDILKGLVDSLVRNLPDLKEIIVIDDASTDNTNQYFSESEGIKFVSLLERVGVATARNFGARIAQGEYIAFLDDDIEFESDFVGPVINYLKTEEKVGIVGPRLVYPDGTLQMSARRFPSLLSFLWRGLGLERWWLPEFYKRSFYTKNDLRSVRQVDWVMGACQVARRKVFEEVGFLDEKYFFGYEDVDFCWRASQKGWKTVYFPQAFVVHHYQRLSARKGIFNMLKWSHLKSGFRFIIKKWRN